MVILTDGKENASQAFSYPKINEMISHQRSHHSWEILFLGANIDAPKECDKLSIDPVMDFTFEATEESLNESYMILNEKLCAIRTR